jgi:hypothetical protein
MEMLRLAEQAKREFDKVDECYLNGEVLKLLEFAD